MLKKNGGNKEHHEHLLVYHLLKLTLLLPVSTASVERYLFSMKFVKSDLRNRMGDEYLFDAHICYIKKKKIGIFAKVDIEDVIQRDFET